MHCNQ
jgi:hypothetical protein